MNVACPSCHTRYSVEDNRIPPSGVTIKCPKCTHSFVVKRDGAAEGAAAPPGQAAGGGAVPLPGTSGGGAVPLPGRQAAGQHPAAAATAPGGSPIGQSGVLNFIDDTAGRAGVGGLGGAGLSEVRVRRTNGIIEGPFGVQRVITMLRNGDLSGNEEISEDGRSWRGMATHPDLTRELNEMRKGANGGGGNFSNLPGPAGPRDLPGLPDPHRDMPIPGDLPGLPNQQQDVLDPASGSPDLARSLGTPVGAGMGDLGGPPAGPNPSPFGGGARPAPAPGPHPPSPPPDGGLPTMGAGPPPTAGIDPSLLEVGEIPQLPSIWEQYRVPILIFAGVLTFAAVGLVTELWTDAGFYGRKAIAELFEEPPPPPPRKPPPPPPKIADAKEIRELIDEGSFEAFRSVLATVKSLGLGADVPDNMLAFAKAHGLATVMYGASQFPIADLSKAVEELNTLNLGKAMGGNAALANLEILKARSALEIATNSAGSAANQLGGAFEQNKEDKEIAYLLGVAREAAGDSKGALEALDRAVVVDPAYAPALYAIGNTIARHAELGPPEHAAWWFEKANTAEKFHALAAIRAAEIYRGLMRPGDRRRMLAAAAEGAARGLPPDDRAEVHFNTALAYEEAERAGDGLKFAEEAARLAPAENKYIAMHAIALTESGNSKKSAEVLTPVLVREPDDITALIAAARNYFSMDDVPNAFKQLDAARKKDKRDHRVYDWEGRFNQQLGKLSDARLSLQTSIQLSGSNDPKPMIALGRLELSVGNIDGALAQARAAVKTDPSSAAAHALLAECYRRRDELKKSMDGYKKALEIDDQNVLAQIGLANALRDNGAKASNPSESPELAQAIPIYIEALRDHPNDAAVIFEYGRALELQNKLDAALQLYQDAAALDAKDPRPHLAIVKAFLEKPNPDLTAAEQSLAKAVELSPTDPNVHFWTARIALEKRQWDAAQRSMETAVLAKPKNAMYHFWLGKVHEGRDSLFEAIGEYEAAIRLNSRLAPAYRALGWSAMARHQFGEARQHFERFRKAAPEDKTIWVDIGQSWTRQNRDEKAMKAFSRALKGNPSDATANVEIGHILSRRGNDKDALTYYHRAAESNPNSGDATCAYGIALASQRRGAKMSEAAEDLLNRCVALANAPTDLKATARQLLDTASTSSN